MPLLPAVVVLWLVVDSQGEGSMLVPSVVPLSPMVEWLIFFHT